MDSPEPIGLAPAPRLEPDAFKWWRGEDSNLRRLSQQIYSLPPLAAREPLQNKGGDFRS